tara:strand:+ start:689 stop:1225 length:537 start_codon:yes stop_codon:yes gene_type:complete
MKYFDELKKSMSFLGKKKNVIFIGQAVEYPGTAMYNTLTDIPSKKKYELPVAEEMQMGITIGLAMNGLIPVSIYPRWNFLLLSTNQIVNHLDKISKLGNGKFKQNIIIRTSIGSERPLHPSHQHVGDFTKEFSSMCKNINFVKLREPKDIFPAYKKAFLCKDNKATVLVEYGDYYNEK